MVHVKKTHWFNPILFEILYKPEVLVNLIVSWWIKSICIYNGLNESSFYQVGAYLQVGSCMRIRFITSQLDLRPTSWDLLWGLDSSHLSWMWDQQDGTCYEGWIPHFSVGSENYKLGLVTKSWVSHNCLNMKFDLIYSFKLNK